MLDQAQGLYKGNSAGKEGKEKPRWSGPEKREFRSLGSLRGVELALCGRRRRPALETGWYEEAGQVYISGWPGNERGIPMQTC
jgi:hypothetical protein